MFKYPTSPPCCRPGGFISDQKEKGLIRWERCFDESLCNPIFAPFFPHTPTPSFFSCVLCDLGLGRYRKSDFLVFPQFHLYTEPKSNLYRLSHFIQIVLTTYTSRTFQHCGERMALNQSNRIYQETGFETGAVTSSPAPNPVFPGSKIPGV